MTSESAFALASNPDQQPRQQWWIIKQKRLTADRRAWCLLNTISKHIFYPAYCFYIDAKVNEGKQCLCKAMPCPLLTRKRFVDLLSWLVSLLMSFRIVILLFT